ncbi:MAG: sulfotransferase [Desulfobacteraceae bacterium]|jgi:hypothetical protein
MTIDKVKRKVINRLVHLLDDQKDDAAYGWRDDLPPPRNRVLKVSEEIRGADRPSAIILHGVMRRSGTNFIGELLGLHPDFCSYPGKVWEAPLLSASSHLIEAQETFLNGFQRNREHFSQTDFLPLFGSAFIAYLHSYVPQGKRTLIKVPGVEQIWNFSNVFPNEKLIILQRDGRDIVASTINSWPEYDFTEMCMKWKKSQELILKLKEEPKTSACCFVKFEDAVSDSKTFIKRLFSQLEIDDTSYPYDQVDQLPIKGSSQIKVEGKMTWKPVEKPKTFNPIGRWRKWTDQQKTTFKEICGETLIRAEYADNLNW